VSSRWSRPMWTRDARRVADTHARSGRARRGAGARAARAGLRARAGGRCRRAGARPGRRIRPGTASPPETGSMGVGRRCAGRRGPCGPAIARPAAQDRAAHDSGACPRRRRRTLPARRARTPGPPRLARRSPRTCATWRRCASSWRAACSGCWRWPRPATRARASGPTRTIPSSGPTPGPRQPQPARPPAARRAAACRAARARTSAPSRAAARAHRASSQTDAPAARAGRRWSIRACCAPWSSQRLRQARTAGRRALLSAASVSC